MRRTVADRPDPEQRTGPAEEPDPRVELLWRALELAGVAPLLAGPLALKHYARITFAVRRAEVADAEGGAYDLPAGADPVLRLAEELKRALEGSQQGPDD